MPDPPRQRGQGSQRQAGPACSGSPRSECKNRNRHARDGCEMAPSRRVPNWWKCSGISALEGSRKRRTHAFLVAFPTQACRSRHTCPGRDRTPVAPRGVSPSIPQCGPHHERTGALLEPRSAGGSESRSRQEWTGFGMPTAHHRPPCSREFAASLVGLETSRPAGRSNRCDVEVDGLVPSSIARHLPAGPDTAKRVAWHYLEVPPPEINVKHLSCHR